MVVGDVVDIAFIFAKLVDDHLVFSAFSHKVGEPKLNFGENKIKSSAAHKVSPKRPFLTKAVSCSSAFARVVSPSNMKAKTVWPSFSPSYLKAKMV